MTDPYRDFSSRFRRIHQPVHLTSHYTTSQKLVASPDDHGAIARTDTDDVHGNAETAGQTATLADCICSEAVVISDVAAVARNDRAS